MIEFHLNLKNERLTFKLNSKKFSRLQVQPQTGILEPTNLRLNVDDEIHLALIMKLIFDQLHFVYHVSNGLFYGLTKLGGPQL